MPSAQLKLAILRLQEYGHVTEQKYREGRTAILRSFLDSGMLFRTHALTSLLQAQAEKNISREIQRLTSTA
jgi:predicted metal-dependent HD superfamily phosphohydrolase